MTDHRRMAVQYAIDHQQDFLENLKQLIAIPSISTSPDRVSDMALAARQVAAHLQKLGMQNVQVMPTGGHPVVYGEWLQALANAQTVLIYGHYDVQPTEPDELWDSPAFAPAIRGENLFGRGASDMKGQIIAVLSAIEAIQAAGPLPVNLKFIIEGEEEIGSPNLGAFLEAHKNLLASHLALNSDAGMLAPDIPTIVYALRGLAYFELRVYGPARDLHSGQFGGAVHNPAQALCELVAGMHDEFGHITLPGFYDSVRLLPEKERAELARLPMGETFYREQMGVEQTWGEPEYSPAERVGARPTLEINGLYSGFIGKGSKTVIPSYAMAKISMRLVPDQDPAEVKRQLESYLEKFSPRTIHWELTQLAGSPASISDPFHPGTQALARALESVWGTPPVYKREGGSVPVVLEMQKTLGIESVLTGFGLPDDNLHAPNEKLHLPTWYKGIQALVHFFYNLEE